MYGWMYKDMENKIFVNQIISTVYRCQRREPILQDIKII